MGKSTGFGWTEVLVVLALLALSLGLGLPALARLGTAARAAAAARDLALDLHALRWRAVSQGATHGLSFERDGAGWSWRVARDGNGNGLRSSEIASGVDPVLSGPHRLGDRHGRISLGFPLGEPIPAVPPRREEMSAGDDPVRFGRSDLVSFTPRGTASSGTIYLTDGRDTVYGVLLYGVTGRVRVWRYARASGRWTL